MRNHLASPRLASPRLASLAALTLAGVLIGACSSANDARLPLDNRVVSVDLAARANADPDERLDVTIIYDFEPPAAVSRGVISPAAKVRGQAQAALTQSITSAGDLLRADLEREGFQIRARAGSYPALFGFANAEELQRLRVDPRIARLRLNQHGQGRTHANIQISGRSPNTMSIPRLDQSFATNAYYAGNQAIGLIETGACRLYDEHQAFYYGKVKYQTSAVACTSSPECATYCGDKSMCVLDVGGTERHCVIRHASQVASAIEATTTGAKYGAASAGLLYANGGSSNAGDFCNDQNILERYEWLIANGVTTVVEAWGCEPDSPGDHDADGPLQDYYARWYDVSVVKSAGDGGPGQIACPHLHNGLCVGGVKLDKTFNSGGSTWINPHDFPHHDREEPDLTALSQYGTEVLSMDQAALNADTRDLWTTTEGGTSFAAPAVGAAVALLKDVCNNRGPGSLPPVLVRAGVMAAAYLADPIDPFDKDHTPLPTPSDYGYSTPEADCVAGDPCDKKDGAGLLYGDALMDLCGFKLTGNKSTMGVVPVEPTGNPGRPPSTPPDGKYGGGAVSGLGLGVVQLNAGEKLRAVISWNTCARYRTGGVGNRVVDIDLWLFNHDTNQWATRPDGSLARSASYDDNNEGFQFESAAGVNVEPYIVWKSQDPCFNPAAEPVGYAVISGSHIPGPP